jgi:hypothetical protein
MTNNIPVAKMHKYLTGLDKYSMELPFIIKDPFSEDQIKSLRQAVKKSQDEASPIELYKKIPNQPEQLFGPKWYDPKYITFMSRELTEYDVPQDCIELMDKHVKPIYPEPLAMAHWNYINYDLKYGNGEYAPSLPPHIDSTETILTFNYILDGNIDWDIYIDGKKYVVHNGEAVVFSALNQVHWRPKRFWKTGEFLEVLTFDYSPLTDWRFTKENDPLDQISQQENLSKYLDDVNNTQQMRDAWELYNNLGLELGIGLDKHSEIG